MKTSTSMAAGWGHPHVTALLSLHLNPNHLGGLMCEMGERFVFWPNGLVGLNDGDAGDILCIGKLCAGAS